MTVKDVVSKTFASTDIFLTLNSMDSGSIYIDPWDEDFNELMDVFGDVEVDKMYVECGELYILIEIEQNADLMRAWEKFTENDF